MSLSDSTSCSILYRRMLVRANKSCDPLEEELTTPLTALNWALDARRRAALLTPARVT